MANLADGLRQLLALGEHERRATLAAFSSQPSAKDLTSPPSPTLSMPMSPAGSISSALQSHGDETPGSPAETLGHSSLAHAARARALAASPPPGILSKTVSPAAVGAWPFGVPAPPSPSDTALGQPRMPSPKKVMLSPCGGGRPDGAAAPQTQWQDSVRRATTEPVYKPASMGYDYDSAGGHDEQARCMSIALSSLLDTVQAQGGPADSRRQSMQWLRAQLEQQQEESLRRLSGVLVGPQSADREDRTKGPARGAQSTGGRAQARGAASGARSGARPGPAQAPAQMGMLPGWDPRLALAAAEAAGMLPPRHGSQADVQSDAQILQKEVLASPKGEQQCAASADGSNIADKTDTLRAHLRALQSVDPSRVVLVRKISKLGFDSGAILQAHYSAFGKVERVLVAHSHVKPQSQGLSIRLRPSGLGFVVMEKAEDAEAIVRAGENQVVSGVQVLARPFVVRSSKDAGDEEENEEGALMGA